jgi:hypothetical protein
MRQRERVVLTDEEYYIIFTQSGTLTVSTIALSTQYIFFCGQESGNFLLLNYCKSSRFVFFPLLSFRSALSSLDSLGWWCIQKVRQYSFHRY